MTEYNVPKITEELPPICIEDLLDYLYPEICIEDLLDYLYPEILERF